MCLVSPVSHILWRGVWHPPSLDSWTTAWFVGFFAPHILKTPGLYETPTFSGNHAMFSCRKHLNQCILLSGKLFLRVHNWYWAHVVLCVRIASCAGKICIHLLQWVCSNVTSSLLIQMESQGKNGREAWIFTCVNCIYRRMVFQEVHKEVPQTLGEQPKFKLESRRGYRAP